MSFPPERELHIQQLALFIPCDGFSDNFARYSQYWSTSRVRIGASTLTGCIANTTTTLIRWTPRGHSICTSSRRPWVRLASSGALSGNTPSESWRKPASGSTAVSGPQSCILSKTTVSVWVPKLVWARWTGSKAEYETRKYLYVYSIYNNGTHAGGEWVVIKLQLRH